MAIFQKEECPICCAVNAKMPTSEQVFCSLLCRLQMTDPTTGEQIRQHKILMELCLAGDFLQGILYTVSELCNSLQMDNYLVAPGKLYIYMRAESRDRLHTLPNRLKLEPDVKNAILACDTCCDPMSDLKEIVEYTLARMFDDPYHTDNIS